MASFVETHGHAVDERDFEALYETYKNDVQRLASYLLKNAADAEDAAQTVFLNVLRALRQGVTPADPRAWLLAITRNVCFSRHRAAAARPVLVELDPDEPAGPDGNETPSAEEIVGALARLLPNQRTALILRDFRGVSRAEISDLMTLSPVAVEALLTRARTAFREELEAGEQPFACAETKKLVEDQLDGLITVADRHSLRSHLRHCTDCSTLARAVRSSRGKLAGLIFWPVDLVSRLVVAFSQAPAIAHVAAAVTSTAAVATIAIPAAISTGPNLAHVEGRVAPTPAPAVAAPSVPSVPARSVPATHAVQAAPVVNRSVPPAVPTVAWHRAAPKAPAQTHVRTPRPAHRAVHRPPAHVFAPPASHMVRGTTHPSTRSGGGSVHALASPSPTRPTAPIAAPARPPSPSGNTAPAAAAPPHPTSPAVKPAVKPATKPKPRSKPRSQPQSKPKPHSKPKSKPKASRKSDKHGGKPRHDAEPPSQTPASEAPAATLGPTGGAGAPTTSPGAEIATQVTSPPATASPSGSSGNNSGSSNGSSSQGDESKDKKDKKDKNDNGNSGGGNGKKH